MNWIQDKLPELKLSLGYHYSWRSALVHVYHEVHGNTQAELHATEDKKEMFWVLRYRSNRDMTPLGEICGWLPMSALPDRPEQPASWQKEEDHPTESIM